MFMKKKAVLYSVFALLLGFVVLFLVNCQSERGKSRPPAQTKDSFRESAKCVYKACGLGGRLDFHIFCRALAGARREVFQTHDIVTIIDYTQPSTARRCFVIDVEKKRLLYQTLVAHGRNSGGNIARRFSNQRGSKTSSLGFYRTGDCYIGKHGYSLKIEGLEEGINNNAMQRHIVIHAAEYVSREFIRKYGRLGRSWGCPALPPALAESIIDTIKGGSCLFIYAANPDYRRRTDFLKAAIADDSF